VLNQSGSYKLEPEPESWEEEVRRLEAQVSLSWEQEARQLTQLGLHDGMTVAELGCGPGFVTRRLLTMLPTSHVTAVEIDPRIHAYAQERLADIGGDRLHLHCASAYGTGLESGQFDFVIARYLFQHLDDPLAVAKEALRLLCPGGQLVVIDVDNALWGIVTPHDPSVQGIYQKMGQWQAQNGGNRLIGRSLWRLLKEAGFDQPQLDAFVYHSDALGMDPFLPQLSPTRLVPALKSGLISPGDFMMANRSYQQFLNAPDAYVLMLGFIAHGRK